MNLENHPCFNESARNQAGRIHLPVAPKCNVQCNYCDRRFDCINESRPGVSSVKLTPRQAAEYLDEALEKIGNISVVGIAGPGDPFANAHETLETLHLVRKKYGDMILCVATNGLEVSKYASDLAAMKVSHVTITVNAFDPLIGEKIYAWARLGPKIYRGIDAALVLLENQLDAIIKLKERNIIVKINTIVIPGINDRHVPDIARQVSQMRADILNLIPIYRVDGTAFGNIEPPSSATMEKMRKEVGAYIPQMSHCGRCRADAAGLLGMPNDDEILVLLKNASKRWATGERPYVAAASMEGLLVNQHLGEAASLWIYGLHGGRAVLIERRPAPAPGGAMERWFEMADLLRDCNTVLVSGIGRNPQEVLEHTGVRIITMEGFISEAVEYVLNGKEIPKLMLRAPGGCGMGQSCGGSGTGCG